jgi:hypothetical protein
MKLDKIDYSEFRPIKERRGNPDMGERPLSYFLFQRKSDGSYWEARPLFDKEDMYYSGGPMEYVEVSKEYVKGHYPDVPSV